MSAARRALAAAPVKPTYAQRTTLAATLVKSAPPSWNTAGNNRGRRRATGRRKSMNAATAIPT